MTVASTTTRELTINKIVLRAYQLAGLMNDAQGTSGVQWENKSRVGRDFLETIMDALQSEGAFARSVTYVEHDIASGTGEYTNLSSSTLDIVGDAMFKNDGETAETVVRQIDRETYMRLSDKTAQGRPTQFFLDRQATLKLYLWPVPDAAGTFTYQQHRKLADNDDGSATLDLQPYWTDYILWELAHHLANANSLPVQTRGYLRSQAESRLKKAKGYAHQRPSTRSVVTWHSPWSK